MLFFSAIASANALLPNYMPQAGEQELNNCLQQKCIGIIGICKKNLLKSLYSEVGKTMANWVLPAHCSLSSSTQIVSSLNGCFSSTKREDTNCGT
jgi:hypothetical protein